MKENAALTKSLEKLYEEDVEQLEIKLEKARKEEKDKPKEEEDKPATAVLSVNVEINAFL